MQLSIDRDPLELAPPPPPDLLCPGITNYIVTDLFVVFISIGPVLEPATATLYNIFAKAAIRQFSFKFKF